MLSILILRNLSHTLTSTHTHYQHISPHRHLLHCIQAGSDYPTAQKTYIKHFSYRKLQTCLSPSFIAKTLEWVVFNQVSLFLSQNNKLDAKQSGFRSGHSTETALLSVTEALRIAKGDSKSSVLILLDLSALLRLSIIGSSCPPSHHWTSLGFHFAGLKPISLVGLSRWPGDGRYPKHINWSLGFPRDRFLDPSSSPHALHWVPSYRHMASPTISMLMIHSSISHFDQMIQHCTDLRLPGGHLGMDERTSYSSTWQRLSFLSSLPHHSTAWLHDSVRFINNYPNSFGQKSWCNLWWSADLQRAHCEDCSILQVCTTQHQRDQALSDRACCTTSCPGPCHF